MRPSPNDVLAELIASPLLSADAEDYREDTPKVKGRRLIWAADCETDPFLFGRVPAPFIWGLYTGEEYHEFDDTEEFVFFVMQHRVVLYAHNGGKFDWFFLIKYIEKFTEVKVINGRLASFKIGDCEFRDSYNIIPTPLGAYKKDEIDYRIFEVMERHKPENRENIRKYLKSDCIYLHEMVTAFVDTYGMHMTQATAAMSFWAKQSKVKKPNSSPSYYEDMSRYYYGGRVQCFVRGEIDQPFTVVDINSAYPKAMMSKHPWGFAFSELDHMPKEFTDDQISQCFITIETASLGAFPSRTDKGLQFLADGERRLFFITGWEYLAARDTGTLGDHPRIHGVRYYTETIDFIKYVEFFYQLKEEAKSIGNDLQYMFAKLFLNSLYGKFASNPEKYQEWMTLPSEYIEAAHAEDGWCTSMLLDEDTALVNRPLPEEKRRYYNVAVSASITGYVRAYLWRSICASDGVLYCDTDSIAALGVGELSISNALGDWSIDARCVKGAIAGKKLYAFEREPGTFDGKKIKKHKLASKGVKLDASQIYKIANGAAITYEPEVPTFSLARGIIFTPRTVKMLVD